MVRTRAERPCTDDPVSPPRDTPQVVREHTFGGGQQQDRAVQLEAENLELRAENRALRADLDQLLTTQREDRECAQAAMAALTLLLEREQTL